MLSVTSLPERLDRFAKRIGWLSTLMSNRISALIFLLRVRLDPSVTGHATHNALNFYFRGCDLSALKEVLIDKEYAFSSSLLKKKYDHKPVVIDVGAHIGLFAIWAFDVCHELNILSVEASPSTFRILEKNALAASREGNVTWQVIKRAAWSDESDISFSDQGDSMSHRVSQNGSSTVRGITFECILDQFEPDEIIELMKIDIEGAEEKFLCDAPVSFDRINALIIELHPNLCDTDRVKKVLKKSFSRIELIKGRTSSKPLLFCQK